MRKRFICLMLCMLIMFVSLLGGCKNQSKSKDGTSGGPENSTVEGGNSVGDETSKEDYSIDESGNLVDENGNVVPSGSYTVDDNGNVITSSGETIGKVTNPPTSPSKTPEKKPNDIATPTNPISNPPSDKPLVVKSLDNLVEAYPPLTTSYIYPDESKYKFAYSSTNIYENEYARVDTNTSKEGYILVTYKDLWATRICVTIDVASAISGKFEKTYQYGFAKGEFERNKPLAVRLPANDASYYIVISSDIQGQETNKLSINVGRVTFNGTASYEYMVPGEEEIKVKKASTGIYTNSYVKIDTTTAKNGYVILEYIDSSGFNIGVNVVAKVKNQRSDVSLWKSNTKQKGKCTLKIPLLYGDTEYTIGVRSTILNSQTGVERESKKAELTIKLTSVSKTGGFLLSAGEVIYNDNMQFIKKANELSKGCKNDFEKVNNIYEWLTGYLKYAVTDSTIVGQYKCDLEKVYNRKTGVCYDYAVVLAAMLRSQGIPCKVVFGRYSDSKDSEGHVWNEIYINQQGGISSSKMSIEGNKWSRLDPTFSTNNSGQNAINYIKNDNNYIWEMYY